MLSIVTSIGKGVSELTDTDGADISRNEYLFHHLVAMFQTLALQQLGKLINPVTGKMERDLQQARITIDMLQMIKEKTTGNLNGREGALLDSIIMELQLNYVDELKRDDQQPEEGPASEGPASEDMGTGQAEVEESGGEVADSAPPKKAKKRKTKATRKNTKREGEA